MFSRKGSMMAEEVENNSMQIENIEFTRNLKIEKNALKHYEDLLAQLRKERQLEK
jgi:hypothetical protein